EAGLVAAGANVLLVGPLPTPGVALLTRSLRADAGIVISASHNPHYDNGIKFFSAAGEKLDDEVELAIEREVDAGFVTVASSNLPHYDNGINLCTAAGEKLEDEVELALEREVDSGFVTVASSNLGKASRV